MANKYFLKSSKIPTTQEKQFKTTLKHHLTLIRMVIITKTNKKNHSEVPRKEEPLYIHSGGVYRAFSKKLKYNYCASQLSTPRHTPKEAISYHRDACSPVFTVILFTTARKRNNRRCPHSDERIKCDTYIHTYICITQL